MCSVCNDTQGKAKLSQGKMCVPHYRPSPRVCGDLQADAKCFQSIAHSYLPTCPNQRVSLSFQWVQRDELNLLTQRGV